MIEYFKTSSIENVNLVLPDENTSKYKINLNFLNQISNSLELEWRKIKKSFFNKVIELKYKCSENYICYLSRYGCSGLLFTSQRNSD